MSRKKNPKSLKRLGQNFGERLKLEREKSGLSQNELAFKTNISPDTIKSLEKWTYKFTWNFYLLLLG